MEQGRRHGIKSGGVQNAGTNKRAKVIIKNFITLQKSGGGHAPPGSPGVDGPVETSAYKFHLKQII